MTILQENFKDVLNPHNLRGNASGNAPGTLSIPSINLSQDFDFMVEGFILETCSSYINAAAVNSQIFLQTSLPALQPH